MEDGQKTKKRKPMFIQIGDQKERVEKNGFGEWSGLDGMDSCLVKQTIRTLGHIVTVGEFLIPAEAAQALFNPDREDGPFIVRIGGANIEGTEKKSVNIPATVLVAYGDLSDEERNQYEAWAALPDDERKATPQPMLKRTASDGMLVQSETKKPAQNAVLKDRSVITTLSWIEFEGGQRFFAPVRIEKRDDVPVTSNKPRGFWWQRAIKKASELTGTSKEERFGKLVEVCEKAADAEMAKPEAQWWVDYLPDDHQNKEKNPRKPMVKFIRDWKTARATNDGAREFRRKRTMWLMKQVERAQKKAGEGR